ncbi:MAG: hypothetical protein HXY18_13025 [Bryobacteraceae bacterium]|nr:hypothetical protein [Bryobacteraceae bacterium]
MIACHRPFTLVAFAATVLPVLGEDQDLFSLQQLNGAAQPAAQYRAAALGECGGACAKGMFQPRKQVRPVLE